MKIVIFSGDEMRHRYFRRRLSCAEGINVLRVYAETGVSKLVERINLIENSRAGILHWHIRARQQAEKDFYGDYLDATRDPGAVVRFVGRDEINERQIVDEVVSLEPSLLVCYGSSIIRSRLLKLYENRFLNVHLGLSPYYRGSGTNVWPIIEGNYSAVGVTFMHINEGIDTGSIIHQIRADYQVGDGPHSIGCRLISRMTLTCIELIKKWNVLDAASAQDLSRGRLFRRDAFNQDACLKLYRNLEPTKIMEYLNEPTKFQRYPIVRSHLLNESLK